jgi:hypothetical protein
MDCYVRFQRKMTVRVSFMTEGGSGTPIPDLSIEVDDLDAALAKVKKAQIPIEYGPASEPWRLRRFFGARSVRQAREHPDPRAHEPVATRTRR